MVLFFVAVPATLVMVTGWFIAFRRQAPRLSKTGLPEPFNNDPSIDVAERLTEEERTAIKTAFLRGPDFKWLAIGDPKYHVQITSFIEEMCFRFTELFGDILVSRDKAGRFQGSLCLIPPYKSRDLYFFHFMRSVIPLGQPDPRRIDREVSERYDAFWEVTDHHHHQVMKDTPHLYVLNLGVVDTAQGKGVGKKLIQTAISMSSKDVPVYLECHDENVAFYEKMGFERKARYMVKPKSQPESAFPYNAMVYEAE